MSITTRKSPTRRLLERSVRTTPAYLADAPPIARQGGTTGPLGGSASAVAILAAWSMLHTKLAAAGMNARLVIHRNSMSYEQPMAGDFTAKASAPSSEAWESFARSFRRKGRARIAMSSTLWYEGREAGRLEGEFVALAHT